MLRAHRAGVAAAGPSAGDGVRARRAWLGGIAKHVCVDWIRQQQRERGAVGGLGAAADDLSEAIAPFDLEAELDRAELLDLLDRAMGQVPADTRALLVAHHVQELPVAEAAGRLGISVGAAAMRLQRGRDAVRRALMTTFRADAVAFGLAPTPAEAEMGLVETRMWCQICGQRRLLGRYAPDQGLHLRCPDCTRGGAVYTDVGWGEPVYGLPAAQFFGQVKGFKAAANRLQAATHAFYKPGIAGRLECCRHCGRKVPLRIDWYGASSHGDIQTLCRHGEYYAGLVGTGAVAGATPEFRAFARRNPRLRDLRPTAIETAGVSALVFSYEALASRERIDFVYARESLIRLSVHGAPGV